MLKDEPHGGVVAETAILLIESKVGGMKVQNQRRRIAFELRQDVRRGNYFGRLRCQQRLPAWGLIGSYTVGSRRLLSG